MIPPVTAPLADDETYLKVRLSVDEMRGHPGRSEMRVAVLGHALEAAQMAGYEITRGPEILEHYLPQYPGDDCWVIAIAVARPISV